MGLKNPVTVSSTTTIAAGAVGQLLASDYGVAVGNSAAVNTTGLNNAIAALLASATKSTLLLDWFGVVDINGELLITDIAANPSVGGRYQGKLIRGVYWASTQIRQTDATKGIFIWQANAGAATTGGAGVGSAFSFARCGITDLKMYYQTQPTRAAGQRAYGIGFENAQLFGNNAFFFMNFDRLWIEGAFVGFGLRTAEYTWQPGMTVTLNQMIVPSPTSKYDNGWTHKWKVTTLGNAVTGAATEPTWAQSGGTTNDTGASTVVYTDQGTGNNVASYFTLWGTSMGQTFIEIHDCTSQAIKWMTNGTGQPENSLFNIYLQNIGVGTASVEPACEFENVEFTWKNCGIEDWKNKLIRWNGDEGCTIDLLHPERIGITVAASSLFTFKLNPIKIGVTKNYNFDGGSVAGNFFEARSTGILAVDGLTTSVWSNVGSFVFMKGTPDSWRISHHAIGAVAFVLFAAGDNGAQDSLTDYNGVHAGGTTRVVPASSATLTTLKEVTQAAPAGNITGIIVAVGLYDGQIWVLDNNSAFTITFNATDATSHVQNSAGIGAVAANTAVAFRWSGGATARWKKMV